MARERRVFFRSRQPILVLGVSFLVWCGGLQGGSPAEARVTSVSSIAISESIQQGRELYETGQYAQAAAVWQQAAKAYQERDDSLNQAMALSNLALAYQQLGNWSQANQAIATSLKLLSTSATNPQHAQVLAQAWNNQGSLQFAQGQAEQALNSWQKATAAYTKAADSVGVTRSLINQAQAQQALGLYRRAITTLNQANQTLQQQPTAIKVTGLRSLGNALRVVGNLSQSQQILQQSLKLAQELKSPEEIAATLTSLGNTVRLQQNPQAALTYYQQAASVSSTARTQLQAQLNQLSLLLETGDLSTAQTLLPQINSHLANLPTSQTKVYARITLAQNLMRLHQAQPQKSQMGIPSWLEIGKLLATAVQEAKDLQDPRAISYALGNLGGLYEQTQQWTSAQELTQQALVLAQGINALDISYRWQWQLGRLLQAQGNTEKAIAAYDDSVQSLQTLRYDLVAINPDVQFSFQEEVEPVYRELVSLLLQSNGTQPSQQNLQKARQTIESLQLAELNNFFRAACLDANRQIDQIVDEQDQTAAAIYPIILRDRLEVIIKLPQQPLRHHTIEISQTEFETTLEQLQQNLIEPDTFTEVQALSQKVYEWLVRPQLTALNASDIKTLVFVLDGLLRNIPMAALYDAQRQQYLIEQYSIALAPGLQLIDPQPLQQQRLQALTAGLSEPRYGFEGLSYVESEIEQITSEVSSQVLLNQDFTSQALQKQVNSQTFPVVHLATHGQFSSNIEQTFILAWDKPINVNELNDLLRNRTQNSSSAIELLVLSACETATGDKRAALGIAGIAVRAGARSTLASLWSVDDQSTALLMSQFYAELASSQVNKATALRQAQLSLLKNPNYAHPMYWSAYVLVGNWL
ncbi:CHAT domain-containing protein [Gloeocapsopsis crepidinum LEGE 06123]|uniref:CHAT domain-containing protein n=1 Tax=Gloeocapsopsis crepidinum LEGE 06123 TaxID=588587 RepID=A0ABR9UNU9_9CHRO|nr:CHAT domain-containing protein [Gloeocapsopsis crepidinum]MBE9189962.1 CHAT domain-containing protein [Gloeocapsopsis crepidinum LEGE 06123]